MIFDEDKIAKILKILANKDHFFVSELHLQTEFIIEASKKYGEFNYYPEYSPSEIPSNYQKNHSNKRARFDLLIKGNDQKVIIEFKYLTKEYKETFNDMFLEVKSHLAFDIRRYDTWRDIERIENFVEDDKMDYSSGFLILITNADAFYKSKYKSGTNDEAFRIHEGEHLGGIKEWGKQTSDGTKKGRESPIYIRNTYYFDYKDFYSSKKNDGRFKYVIVPITKHNDK